MSMTTEQIMLFRLTQINKNNLQQLLQYIFDNEERNTIDESIIEWLFIYMSGGNKMKGFSIHDKLIELAEKELNNQPPYLFEKQ